MSDTRSVEELQAELKQLAADRVERLNREDMNRRSRFSEVGIFLSALRSHASVDRDWLKSWEETLYEILEGRMR